MLKNLFKKSYEHEHEIICKLEALIEKLSKLERENLVNDNRQTLNLLKNRGDILDTVFTKVIKEKDYNHDKELMEKELKKINEELDKRVDKSSVKLIWWVLTAIPTAGGLIAIALKFNG